MRSFVLLASAAVANAACYRNSSFDNLVAFGDSYTDDGRLSYYVNNGGNPPPPGTIQTQSTVTASGGLTWAQYVQQDVGVALFDYAVSGAVCSNAITPRYLSLINRTFPAVIEDELPSFVADTGFQTLYANRSGQNTVYSLWIGTNDLGVNAFLTDSQVAGTNITTFTTCIWQVLDTIYATGGRRFVLFNEAPLQLAPLYHATSDGGAGDNQYWANKTDYNTTIIQYKMLEYTQLVNQVFDYGVPFNLLVKTRWPGATFSIFDVHALITDIYYNPSLYLDAPANSTGFYHVCNPLNTSDCVDSPNSLDTFLWYDELHPSNKTDSIIAQEFLAVVNGTSSYGTCYGH